MASAENAASHRELAELFEALGASDATDAIAAVRMMFAAMGVNTVEEFKRVARIYADIRSLVGAPETPPEQVFERLQAAVGVVRAAGGDVEDVSQMRTIAEALNELFHAAGHLVEAAAAAGALTGLAGRLSAAPPGFSHIAGVIQGMDGLMQGLGVGSMADAGRVVARLPAAILQLARAPGDFSIHDAWRAMYSELLKSLPGLTFGEDDVADDGGGGGG